MSRKFAVSATLVLAASLAWPASASTFSFALSGPGVSGTIQLTYGAATDSKNAQAFEVTAISGIFSDSNNGLNIVNAAVGPLIAVTNDLPEAGNVLAPHDFSRFAVAAGLGPESNGFLTYDNLFYPNGSPQTANDYPPHGGFLDIYGLLFSIGNGQVVDFWSNGDTSGSGVPDYGIAVATKDLALDYVGGVSPTPEPSTFALLGSGLLGMLVWRKRAARQSL